MSYSSTLYFGLALLLGWVSTFIYRGVQYESARRRAKCGSPVSYRHKDPVFGLDLFLLNIRAIKEGRSLDVERQLFRDYGMTVRTNMLGTTQYLTMDSRNMQHVLATNVDSFGVEPMNRQPCLPLIGNGVITTDGAAWKKSRQLINPIFARAQISDLSQFDIHFQQMLRHIPRDASTVDLQPLLKQLFLDTSTEFIFGQSANSLARETGTPMARELPAAFDDALRGMRKRFMLGRFKFLAGDNKKYDRKRAKVHDIIDMYIDDEIERQRDASSTSEDSAPYSYVLLRELVRSGADKRTIRDELLNIFFPGRDTAAVVTGNAFFLLARHPQVWAKLRKEALSLGSQELSFELLKNMKFVQNVVNETLRILSPVARSWKTCIKTSILPYGGGRDGQEPILLMPGDQVNMAFSSTHIDPEIWGKDAQEFNPERWAGLKYSWQYIPFLGGRRICPAQQQALTEIAFVLIKFAQMYEFCENRDESMSYVEEQVFTKESRNGIKVAFR